MWNVTPSTPAASQAAIHWSLCSDWCQGNPLAFRNSFSVGLRFTTGLVSKEGDSGRIAAFRST
jgi:hypothetical protein